MNKIINIILVVFFSLIIFLIIYFLYYKQEPDAFINPKFYNNPDQIYKISLADDNNLKSYSCQFYFKNGMPQNFINDEFNMYQASYNDILFTGTSLNYELSCTSSSINKNLFNYGPFIHVNNYVMTCITDNGCVSMNGNALNNNDTEDFYSICYPFLGNNKFCMDATTTTKDSNFLKNYSKGKAAFISLNVKYYTTNNKFYDVYNMYDDNGNYNENKDNLSLLYINNPPPIPTIKSFYNGTINDPNFVFYVQRGDVKFDNNDTIGTFSYDINGPVVRIVNLQVDPILYLGFKDISSIDNPPIFLDIGSNTNAMINWQLIPYMIIPSNASINNSVTNPIERTLQLIGMPDNSSADYYSDFASFKKSIYTYHVLCASGSEIKILNLPNNILPGYDINNDLIKELSNTQIIYHETMNNFNNTQTPYMNWTYF